MLILKRTYEENYTKGDLIIPNIRTIDILELPYKDNQQNISCIPEGNYILKTYNSPKFKKCLKIYKPLDKNYWLLSDEERQININKTIKLTEVKGRSGILIHSGNVVNDFSFYNNFNQLINYKCDSRGCLLIGYGSHKVLDQNNEEQCYITDSRKALIFLFNYVKVRGGIVELLITKGKQL